MKQSLFIALFSTLVVSCTKQDFEENEISKDIIKASASIDMTDKQPRIIINNYNYYGTKDTYISLYNKDGDKLKEIDFFGKDIYFILYFDKTLEEYTYNDMVINRIDLNNGGTYKNIYFNPGGDITYSSTKKDEPVIIQDYKTIGNERFYSVIDPVGIYGGPKNAIIQTYRDPIIPELIKINIMPWASYDVNLDGNEHFFNTADVTQLCIINMDYRSRGNKDAISNVILLFEDDESTVEYTLVQKNSYILLDKKGDYFYYNYKKLKQIDFNNGRPADDLNFSPNIVSQEKTIEYIARNSKYPVPIIDLEKGFIFGTVDADGIGNGPMNAKIDAHVVTNELLAIKIYR